MKTLENRCLALWFAFLILILFVSCKSQQLLENKTNQKHYKFQFDSSLVKITNTPDSNESLFVSVPAVKTVKPECDSVCQAKIDEILKGISSKKINGKNNSGFYYDSYNKMLVAYSNLKGSTDSIIKNKKGKDEYFEIKKTNTITVNVLTKEQKFNLWTGRIFWIGFLAWGIIKLRNKFMV